MGRLILSLHYILLVILLQIIQSYLICMLKNPPSHTVPGLWVDLDRYEVIVVAGTEHLPKPALSHETLQCPWQRSTVRVQHKLLLPAMPTFLSSTRSSEFKLPKANTCSKDYDSHENHYGDNSGNDNDDLRSRLT